MEHSEKSPYLVVLPVLSSASIAYFLPLAEILAARHEGEVLLLQVVTSAEKGLPGQQLREIQEARAALDLHEAETTRVRRLVVTGPSEAEAIARVAHEQRASLLLLGWTARDTLPERLFGSPMEALLSDPPCPIVVAREYGGLSRSRILLAAGGGPHMPLAFEVAHQLADEHNGAITVLHAAGPDPASNQAARRRVEPFLSMVHRVTWVESPLLAEQAIVEASRAHDVVIIGVTGKPNDPEAPVGPIVSHVIRHAHCSVLLVSHPLDDSERKSQAAWQRELDSSARVDRWFSENTFSASEFDELWRLVSLKQTLGTTLSLALPALNEAETIGQIIHQTRKALMVDVPLLDEIVLIDSGSQDRTREIAREEGVPVFVHQEVLPQYGAFHGKGEALWKSLHILKGDLIGWVDTDIRNFHPRFIYGIFGPLLRDESIVYTKGFYRRPLQQGTTRLDDAGGRVTELTARPLINLFYPLLSGFMQPLSGEYAGRRAALERIPFFTGYGVEIGLLIDLLDRYGLDRLTQVNLEQRVHRNQSLSSLSRMAFAIMQVALGRLEQRRRVNLVEPVNQSMKAIQHTADGFHLDVRLIRDHERPPIATLPEYQAEHHSVDVVLKQRAR